MKSILRHCAGASDLNYDQYKIILSPGKLKFQENQALKFVNDLLGGFLGSSSSAKTEICCPPLGCQLTILAGTRVSETKRWYIDFNKCVPYF